MKTLVMVLLALCSNAYALECDSDEIACSNEERCIPHSFICDSDDDCYDESDEDYQLCSLWREDYCGRGTALCTIDGVEECLSIVEYCAMTNPSCEGDLDRRLCQMLDDGILQDVDDIVVMQLTSADNFNKSMELAEKFRSLIPVTLSHANCPPMYTLVDDQCLSIFHIGSMSWGESREFCKILGGDLITFRNISHYASVVQHLQQNELTSNFWVGGSMASPMEGWAWVDGMPMELGSPYWATRYSTTCVERNVTVSDAETVCFRYEQAPSDEPRGQCAGLDFEQYFYMIDEDCIMKMSPLCVFQG